MVVLLTGCAGFIGFHISKLLLKNNFEVIGIDNLNDYYDINLKKDRLKKLGIHDFSKNRSTIYENFNFFKKDIGSLAYDDSDLKSVKIDLIINLAAQAGVRYSITNPSVYINSNINGFFNILEFARHNNIKNIIYASSSSIYGNSDNVPFKEVHQVDKPISLYAATKKSNELIAHTYSHIYGMNMIGLRFFTVYGSWGRPDMAIFKFTKNIEEGKPIDVYNEGNLSRDFTHISDIVEGVNKVISLISKKIKVFTMFII